MAITRTLSTIFQILFSPQRALTVGLKPSPDHTDYSNLSHGLCTLTALGSYDYKQGGHLILFGLKLVIQFPPGLTAVGPHSICMLGSWEHSHRRWRNSDVNCAIHGRWAFPLGFLWVPICEVAHKKNLTKSSRCKLIRQQVSNGERFRRVLSSEWVAGRSGGGIGLEVLI